MAITRARLQRKEIIRPRRSVERDCLVAAMIRRRGGAMAVGGLSARQGCCFQTVAYGSILLEKILFNTKELSHSVKGVEPP